MPPLLFVPATEQYQPRGLPAAGLVFVMRVFCGQLPVVGGVVPLMV